MDRNFYNTWTNDWGFVLDVILYACELSKDKANAMSYLNKILSNWNGQGVKTLDKAKLTKVDQPVGQGFIHNTYTKEQRQVITMQKTINLFVDMDGTIAKFYYKKNCLEKMYEQGYFAKLPLYSMATRLNK